MIEFILHSFWAQCGVVVVIIAACIVVGYLFPPLRRVAIEIIAVLLAATALVAKGKRDEDRKWNDAISKDVQKGQAARTDAERDVDAGHVSSQQWDRDRGM